jgi:hypothetical protein
MIATYVKLIFAAAILLAQPTQRDYDRGHVRNGVVATRSNHASSIPAQRFSKAVARLEIPTRGEGSRPAANANGVSDTAREKTADTHSTAGAGVNSDTRTVQEQVMAATTVAERMTVSTLAAPESEANKPGHTEKTAQLKTDSLVAILMARPEIRSISDLTRKTIAIDEGQFASAGNVRTAIAAAGAVEVQLSVISGEVPAAVLTLVSEEAAKAFPDIAGFKIIRVPLSPDSSSAKP